MVKVITVIKGCGKSYLLNKLLYNYLIQSGVKEDHIISVAIDNLENLKLHDLFELDKYIKDKIIDKNMYFIFFRRNSRSPTFCLFIKRTKSNA